MTDNELQCEIDKGFYEWLGIQNFCRGSKFNAEVMENFQKLYKDLKKAISTENFIIEAESEERIKKKIDEKIVQYVQSYAREHQLLIPVKLSNKSQLLLNHFGQQWTKADISKSFCDNTANEPAFYFDKEKGTYHFGFFHAPKNNSTKTLWKNAESWFRDNQREERKIRSFDLFAVGTSRNFHFYNRNDVIKSCLASKKDRNKDDNIIRCRQDFIRRHLLPITVLCNRIRAIQDPKGLLSLDVIKECLAMAQIEIFYLKDYLPDDPYSEGYIWYEDYASLPFWRFHNVKGMNVDISFDYSVFFENPYEMDIERLLRESTLYRFCDSQLQYLKQIKESIYKHKCVIADVLHKKCSSENRTEQMFKEIMYYDDREHYMRNIEIPDPGLERQITRDFGSLYEKNNLWIHEAQALFRDYEKYLKYGFYLQYVMAFYSVMLPEEGFITAEGNKSNPIYKQIPVWLNDEESSVIDLSCDYRNFFMISNP